MKKWKMNYNGGVEVKNEVIKNNIELREGGKWKERMR